MHREIECQFHGKSQKALESFPYKIREGFLFAIIQLINGQKPNKTKDLNGLGKGVKEIYKNGKPAYRCVYVIKNDVVHILHVFVKTSDATDSKHEKTVKQRYKSL